ncbi:unnamed protein product [Symbiodinium natans]|uniref:SH3 domain-containing protein n=1 Tax=Symbiodinium natans TaxID=878477 RepID=A0A812M396_9DINO|nr:unnamed protein product [Symbiodinium natans]
MQAPEIRDAWPDSKDEGLDQSLTSCTRSSSSTDLAARGKGLEEPEGDVEPQEPEGTPTLRSTPAAAAPQASLPGEPPDTFAPSAPSAPSRSVPSAPSRAPVSTGLFQADRQWEALEGGTLAVQRGTCVWVLQLDPNSDWALGQVFKDWSMQSDAGWVPRCVLREAYFRVYSPYDPSHHAEVQALALKPGDLVTVQSFGNGWSYGNRVGPGNTVEASGWFPQTCIFQPLPLQ